MKFNVAWVVYILGMLPLAFACYPLKDLLPPYGFVAAAVVYLIALRLLAEYLADRFERRRDDETR